MSDEGVGLAGWLLADLVLVLALVFLSFTPAALSDDLDAAQTTATPIAAEPPVEAPRILDLGCEQDERVAGVIPVRCKPRLGGGEVNSHSWEADRGRAFSYTGGDFFTAGFADTGAVRLTVSNAGGEHSAAFPVLPSSAAATPVPTTSPLVLDIGCEIEASDGRTEVRCIPEIEGGTPASYEWTAQRGEPKAGHSPTFEASFEDAGAVRLTVSNPGGEDSAAFLVLPPPVPPDLDRGDFSFDQIVFCGATLGEVTWEAIAAGRVRKNLTKNEELSGESCQEGDVGAEAFLLEKQRDGLRIAIVETFSNLDGEPLTALSAQVNDVFHEALRGKDFFAACDARERSLASYFSTNKLEPGDVRINIFFVYQPGGCR